MNDKKMFYVFVTCLVLSIFVVGATYAYFTSSASDNTTVKGDSSFNSFSLSVSKVTSLDLTFGLIPMKNIEAPYAAEQMCFDSNENVGCQIYKITLSYDSDDSILVDGYITTSPMEGIETRYTRVYPKDVNHIDSSTGEDVVSHVFGTSYTKEDMLDNTFDMDKNIKSGKMVSVDESLLNRDDDYSSLFVSDIEIGGENNKTVDLYFMVWIYDDGNNQDFAQGSQIVYTGTAIFVSSSGSKIKASFD